MRDSTKIDLSWAAATLVTVGSAIGSAIWLDKIMAPALRGTGFEFLMLPCIAFIIFGVFFVWMWTYRAVAHILDGPE